MGEYILSFGKLYYIIEKYKKENGLHIHLYSSNNGIKILKMAPTSFMSKLYFVVYQGYILLLLYAV